MKRTLTILTAILFITTTALQAQTDTLVTMKSNITTIRISVEWTPFGAGLKANGINLMNGMSFNTYIPNDGTIVITTDDNAVLTKLQCSNNQLTKLNVEKNTALRELLCDNNYLTELNVAKNTVLTTLDCGSNRLTELNVEKNTALKDLRCCINELTELNVEKNTALTSLSCFINNLTELNVEKNTALTTLSFYDNGLTELNVKKNTALTTLSCSGNHLTELNVEKNTVLTILACGNNPLTQLNVAKNTNLTKLYCDRNQLTELNVENNTALTELWCNENQLTKLNVENNTDLFLLYANDQQIEVPLSGDAVSFANPIYYKTSAGEQTVEIGTIWYAYQEDVPKVEGTIEFTTNLPAGVYGNAFGGTITFMSGVGINQVATEQLSVYPNPTTGIVNIATEGNPEVKIYNMHGQLVRIAVGSEIDLAGLPNGVYLLQVGNTRTRVVKN